MANVDLKTNFKNGDKLYDYELNNNFKAIQAALGAMNKIVWQNDDNASLVMFAGTTEQITNRELIEGQLLYNTQTGETYIDAMVDTELKRVSTGGGTSIQIGGIEPTNLATKLWVEDDMLDNIGSEIESGSNENGSYIKFADGTMIQHKSLVITTANQATTNVELPIDYLNSGFTILVNSLNYHSSNINYSSNSTSKNTFEVIATDNETGTTPTSAEAFSYVTIGRWK